MKGRSRKGEFVRRTPLEEFQEYTDNELRRLRDSDADVDEGLYRQAVELVVQKLNKR